MEQRRTQRYKLQLPLQIREVDSECVYRTATTRDISSSGGVCFVSSSRVKVGELVDYILTLSDSNPPVRIRCLGKILRSQTPADDGTFEVAVTMERYSFVRDAKAGPLGARPA